MQAVYTTQAGAGAQSGNEAIQPRLIHHWNVPHPKIHAVRIHARDDVPDGGFGYRRPIAVGREYLIRLRVQIAISAVPYQIPMML